MLKRYLPVHASRPHRIGAHSPRWIAKDCILKGSHAQGTRAQATYWVVDVDRRIDVGDG